MKVVNPTGLVYNKQKSLLLDQRTHSPGKPCQSGWRPKENYYAEPGFLWEAF